MSLTLTLSGRSSILTENYFPALDFSDGEYELGLTNFETYNSIQNVDSTNNKFYFDFDDKIITIPEGSYEIKAISRYLKAAILHRQVAIDGETSANDEYIYDNEDHKENERSIILRANENTMKSEIKCAFQINFSKPNNIGPLLGFSTSRILQPNKWYASDNQVNIMSVNIICVECNITTGAYYNDKPVHTIYKFSANVPPGYKLSKIPKKIIYLPVIARSVTDITYLLWIKTGN